MRLWWQQFLGQIDRAVSAAFRFSREGSGDSQSECWTYFLMLGPRIGIVGANGKIHTITGYFAVRHYILDGILIRRSVVRRELQPGERLATRREIAQWRIDVTERYANSHGISQ